MSNVRTAPRQRHWPVHITDQRVVIQEGSSIIPADSRRANLAEGLGYYRRLGGRPSGDDYGKFSRGVLTSQVGINGSGGMCEIRANGVLVPISEERDSQLVITNRQEWRAKIVPGPGPVILQIHDISGARHRMLWVIGDPNFYPRREGPTTVPIPVHEAYVKIDWAGAMNALAAAVRKAKSEGVPQNIIEDAVRDSLRV